jgi:hypothetical protein
MPAPSSPCSCLGSRQTEGDRSSDQSSGVRFKHYRGHLQRHVGDRNLLQNPEQHLKVKTFIGTSENALRIQIWTAFIVLLLFKYLHHLARFHWLMSNLSTMLRLNLFTYRDLLRWLHDPFGIPPPPPVVQLRLPGKKKRRTWFEEIAFKHFNILEF